jgi:hypothetical protein
MSWDLPQVEAILYSARTIPAESVREWLESDNPQIVTAGLRAAAEHRDRIAGVVPVEEMCLKALSYFRRNFPEVLSYSTAEARHEAGRSFCAWFAAVSADDSFPREALQDLKGLLAQTYREGNAALRQHVVVDVLEPLFESRRLAAYFIDWQEDPELREPFAQALDWGQAFWP